MLSLAEANSKVGFNNACENTKQITNRFVLEMKNYMLQGAKTNTLTANTLQKYRKDATTKEKFSRPLGRVNHVNHRYWRG